MHKVLEDLPGVLCMTDDIIIFGESSEEHDARVRAVFRRLEDNGVTLNFEKCEFAKSSITYLGHVVSADGIRADPSKVRAIRQMQTFKDVSDIRRFLGMANQLGKFIPNLSTVTQPLRDLLQNACAGVVRPKSRDDCVSWRIILWTWGCPTTENQRHVVPGGVRLESDDADRETVLADWEGGVSDNVVVRAVQRLPLRDVVSRGDGPQATCLASEFKEELRRTIATHPTFSNAFDAIHVHDRSCTRKEPRHGRRPVACSPRATTNRDWRAIDARSDGTSKPGCGCVTGNREASGRDPS